MKNYLYIGLFTIVLISCGEKRTCTFDTLENAVNCACEISKEQEEAKEDDEIIDKLKMQTEALNDPFEQALKDSIFTEQEFIQKLKADCESYK